MSAWAVVILAAGQGKRMRSRTPKVLHHLAGKPMVRHVVEAVRPGHSGRVVVVVPPGVEAVRAAVGDVCEFVEQPEPRGTGDALLRALSLLDGRTDHLLVLGADCPLIRGPTLAALRQHHLSSGAKVTLLTSTLRPPENMGRIVRDSSGHVTAIVEEAEAGVSEDAIGEVNAGIYCFEAAWLWPRLRGLRPRPAGEVYLTDVVAVAHTQGAPIATLDSRDPVEVLGVNNRIQLAQAEKLLRRRIRERWMLEGVTLIDPDSTLIDAEVELGQDTVVYPATGLFGATRVGQECRIGPNAAVTNCTIGDACHIEACTLEGAVLEESVHVGPYSHLRAGTVAEAGVHIGTCAEVKNSRLGRGARMGHFSYVGDATVGPGVNIGAGAVTCNYDGVTKHRTVIEEGAFIGSACMLVAPVRVGARATTGAGSVVTRDVPPDSVVVGVPARAIAKAKSAIGSGQHVPSGDRAE